MATHLSFAQHLDGLRRATLALTRHAADAGLEAVVPPCPGWTVRRLVDHQGYVHRWARAALLGDPASVDEAATEKAGRGHADPLEWLRDGVVDLVQALVAVPEDHEALVFLHDAPPARLFWARRQHHETLVHAIDALAASLGRLPRAADPQVAALVSTDVALDGIDELVLGFVPRSRSRMRRADPVTVAIRTPDAPWSWTVRVTEDAPVVARHAVGDLVAPPPADLVVEGPAVDVYLALWHRTDSVVSDAWPLWRDSAVS